MKTRLMAVVLALVCSAFQTQASSTWSDASTAADLLVKGKDSLSKGHYDEARRYYDAAVTKDPKEWPCYYERAKLFTYQKKWDLAIQDLNTVLRLQPNIYEAAIKRADINQIIGNFGSSLAEYDNVLKGSTLLPWIRATALKERAWLRATCRDPSFRNGKLAVADARAACNINAWRDSDFIDTLAAACAEAGDFDSAIKYEQQALNKERDETTRKGFEQHLAQFRAHQPIRRASK